MEIYGGESTYTLLKYELNAFTIEIISHNALTPSITLLRLYETAKLLGIITKQALGTIQIVPIGHFN